MELHCSLQSVTDDALLLRLGELTRESRRVEVDLVAHLGEVDARRLYAREASPSMFVYCTEVLHLSEAEAYLRIAAARASRAHPVLLTMLADGRLHLSAIARLAPHLTPENRDHLLGCAAHRSKREIEALVAVLSPRPDAVALIRKLPERRVFAGSAPSATTPPQAQLVPGAVALELVPERVRETAGPHAGSLADPDAGRSSIGNTRPASIEPLSPARYKVQFTAGASLRDKLERLQALMRSTVPDGDLAAIVEAAVSEKLERLEAKRLARTRKPRKTLAESDTTASSSRHIPAAVKRIVLERDGSRCRFVDAQGRRCSERSRLEFHHRHPHGFGGDRSPQNIALVCRAHNAHLASVDYGTLPTLPGALASRGPATARRRPPTVVAPRHGGRRGTSGVSD